jgi:hypothetical protein
MATYCTGELRQIRLGPAQNRDKKKWPGQNYNEHPQLPFGVLLLSSKIANTFYSESV